VSFAGCGPSCNDQPTIGFGDPSHTPRTFTSGRLQLDAEGHAYSQRFDGSIALDTSCPTRNPRRSPSTCSPRAGGLGTYTPGVAKVVPFGLVVRSPWDLPAGIRVIRVAGFAGVAVAPEKKFHRDSEALDGLARAVSNGARWLVGGRKPDDPPALFSLDVDRDDTGRGEFRVTVPEGTPPGRHTGRLELEGNFEARALPLELEVARYEDRVAALLDKLDAPERELPLWALFTSEHEEVTVSVEAAGGDPETEDGGAPPRCRWPQREGAWKRWLVAGSGIWDLGALEWLGPITDTAPRSDDERALAGPREAPRLFAVNGPGVDVISIRDRRTVARLGSPGLNDLTGPLCVSPNGDRVLARCGGSAICFFESAPNKFDAKADACSALTCEKAPAEPPRLVEGTTVRYKASFDSVEYKR
jgi:hypothetical protein